MKDKLVRNALIAIGLSLVFFLIGILGRQYLMDIAETAQTNTSVVQMQLTEGCQLDTAPCVASAQDQSITVRLSETVHYLKPFQLSINLDGFNKAKILRVEAIFDMQDMEMGLNRYLLDNMAKQVWSGRIILPVCNSGRSDWRVTVKIITDTGQYQALLPLQVN